MHGLLDVVYWIIRSSPRLLDFSHFYQREVHNFYSNSLCTAADLTDPILTFEHLDVTIALSRGLKDKDIHSTVNSLDSTLIMLQPHDLLTAQSGQTMLILPSSSTSWTKDGGSTILSVLLFNTIHSTLIFFYWLNFKFIKNKKYK